MHGKNQPNKLFLDRPLLLILALVLLLVSSPAPSLAISDLLVGSLIDDGIASLSRGGMAELPQRQESLDFDSPLFLDSQGKFRVESAYEYQRTLRLYKGRWSGTHAYSNRLETSAAAPYSLFDERIKGSIAVGYGDKSVDVRGENHREELTVTSKENIEAFRGGIYFEALNRIKVGVAAISNNVRDGLEVPIEAEVAPFSFFKLGYKRSYLNLVSDLHATMSGHSGTLPVRDLEEINELYTILDYNDLLYLKYANELQHGGNRKAEGKLRLPASIYLVGSYSQRTYAPIDEEFTVDGEKGGTFNGLFKKRVYRVGLGGEVTKKWSVEANYRHGDFISEGGGVALTSAVASFWPSLLVGNYHYLYSASLKSTQYHLGTQYQGERVSFGLGFQYLDLRPQGEVDYWRNVLFGLGKTGADRLKLTVDRVEMLFLSFGVGYRWQNIAINYGFGQFIPIAMHDTDEKTGETSETTGGGHRSFFSSLWDKIIHNPGGNLQRVMLTVTF